MNRIFFGVGQGAFYCEQFEEAKFQLIYDCGSFERKKLVSSIENPDTTIGKLDSEYETVLFISHFHADHINGIPFLIKRLKEKKLNLRYIIFPYLAPKDRNLLIVYNKWLINYVKEHETEKELLGDDKFITQFILNPYKAINESFNNENESELQAPKLYCIAPYKKGRRSRLNMMQTDSWKAIDIIDSGIDVNHSILKEKIQNYKFITYNLRSENIRKKLKRKIKQEFGKKMTTKKLNALYLNGREEDIKKVNRIFRSIGELNTNTMIMLSCGNSLFLSSKPALKNEHNHNDKRTDVFLYMGDYNAKKYFVSIKRLLIANNIDKNCGLQIPHHGSKYSFNYKLLERCDYCIISANQNFRFKHPDDIVVDCLNKKKRPYSIVNDEPISINYNLPKKV